MFIERFYLLQKLQRFSTKLSAPKKEAKKPCNKAVTDFLKRKDNEQAIKKEEFKKKRDVRILFRYENVKFFLIVRELHSGIIEEFIN